METAAAPPSDVHPPAAELGYHPADALFPLMPVDGPEFGELVADFPSKICSSPWCCTRGASSTADRDGDLKPAPERCTS